MAILSGETQNVRSPGRLVKGNVVGSVRKQNFQLEKKRILRKKNENF